MSRTSARSCCTCPTSRRSRSSARRTSGSSSNFRAGSSPILGLDRAAVVAALCRRRTSSQPAGAIQTGDETLSQCASRGAFGVRAGHPRHQFRRRRTPDPPRRHRDRPARLRRSAAADVPRQRRAGDRTRHRDARRRRHSGARQEHRQSAMKAATADLPLGIQPHAGRRPGGHGEERDLGIHANRCGRRWRSSSSVSFIALGVRRGTGRGAGDPADARDRLRGRCRSSTSTCSASRSAR